MTNLRILLLLAAASLAPLPANADSQIFELPRVKGVLLDWCYTWGQDCGQLPADRFCAMNKFAGASDFSQKPGPLGEPTRLISDGSFCDEESCATYEYISCEGSQKPVGRFDKPAFQGIRVDWCYEFSAECGEKAANRFCSAQGFKKAAEFQIEANIGHTVTLATGRECTEGTCDGFEFIQCKK